MLTAARRVRCAGCGQDWQTEPIDLETARLAMQPGGAAVNAARGAVAPEAVGKAGPAAVPAPDDPDAPPTPPAGPPEAPAIADARRGPAAGGGRRRVDWPAVGGWGLSLAILVGGGHAVLSHAPRIAAAWPASRRLFQWLGVG